MKSERRHADRRAPAEYKERVIAHDSPLANDVLSRWDDEEYAARMRGVLDNYFWSNPMLPAADRRAA